PEQRRQALAEIARERLVQLVYGEVVTDADRVELARLAEAAGVPLEAVLPTTGEPGVDPRTHRPAEEASPVRPAPAPHPALREEAPGPDGQDAALTGDVVRVSGADPARVAGALTPAAARAVLREYGITATVLARRVAARARARAEQVRIASSADWVARRQAAVQLPVAPRWYVRAAAYRNREYFRDADLAA